MVSGFWAVWICHSCCISISCRWGLLHHPGWSLLVIFYCLRWMWEFSRESRQIEVGVAVSARISHFPEWSLCCDKCCVCWGGLEVLRFGWGAVGDFSNVGFTSYYIFLVQDLVGCSSPWPYLKSLGMQWDFLFWVPLALSVYAFPCQFESLMSSRDTSTHIPLCWKWDGRHESSSLSSFLGIMKRNCLQLQHWRFLGLICRCLASSPM